MNVIRIPTSLQLLRDVLSERGISLAMAKRAGLRALSREQLQSVTGFSWIQGPGIEIPYNDLQGKRSEYVRWKIFNHPGKKYVAREKSGSMLYFPPNSITKDWATNASVDVHIVEGELKTLSAVENLKVCAIGISGVWNFVSRRALEQRAIPLPEFDLINWKDRRVTICFDSDWRTKSEVRQALLTLGIELDARGADLFILDLPDIGLSKTGLDDWIVHMRKQGKNPIKEFGALTRNEFDPARFFDGLSELDFARRLSAHFSDRVRFVGEMKKWFVMNPDTQLWKEDMTGEVWRIAKQLPNILIREAQHTRNQDKRKEVLRAAASAGNKKRLEASIALLASEAGIPLLVKDMDSNPYLLSLPGGKAIELRTMTERPLRLEDYVTKVAGSDVASMGTSECPYFLRFLSEVFQENQAYIDYIQRALGYCLSGDIGEQCIFILYGTGANGKSTLLSLLRSVLGDYAVQAGPETFMVQKGNSTRGDLVRLRGARVIATSELEEGQRLAESVIKQLTGGEPLVARQLYCEPVEFAVTGKLFIATNHKPKVRGVDHAIWRRIHLWPFDLRLPKEKQDPSILPKLRAERPGILRWMLEGFREWQSRGLNPPPKVLNATAGYRAESDAIGAWLAEWCIVSSEESTFGPKLYQSYSRYCDTKHEYCPTQRDFYRRMTERDFESKDTTQRTKGEKGKFFLGISLNAEGAVRKFDADTFRPPTVRPNKSGKSS